MIIAAIIACLALYVWTVIVHGTVLTPDGQFYLAMGEGAAVPSPYSGRSVARMLGGVASWRMFHMACYALTVSLIAIYIGAWCALLYAAIPSVRRSAVWPVLLDAPMQAAIVIGALVYDNPLLFLLVVIVSLFVHERTPLHMATTACFIHHTWIPLVVVGFVYLCYAFDVLLTKERESTGIDWLDRPLRTCTQHHMNAPLSSWLVPWGGTLAWLCVVDVYLLVHAFTSYACCLVAMDRARIYQAAPLPFVMAACAFLPTAWLPLALGVTLSISMDEV